MVAKNIPLFLDFPRASGGITCDGKFYLLSDGDLSIRCGTDDAARTNIRPRIDLDRAAPNSITMYCDDRGAEHIAGIRPRVDAGSGVMTVVCASGLYYGVFSSTVSGVPTSVSAYGVIPWAQDININDKHFHHVPSDSKINTHVMVLLDGWYDITYTVALYKAANNTSASNYVRCVKNNTNVLAGSVTLCATLLSTQGNTTTWKGMTYLKAGDTLSVQVREFITTAGDVLVMTNGCSFFIKYLGPAL